MFSIISAIGKNNEIGKKGGLIFKIKDDMKFFRETTLDHKIIMGQNTWFSLPGKLKNRENIVVSLENLSGPDRIINNLDDFIKENQGTDEEIFIIGGGSIYKQFLPYTTNLYLTEVDGTDNEATVFFPEFDKTNYTKTLIKKGSENGLDYSIVKYTKK
ncbi:dihydrofolate reductase [Candidatus Saccharibacteria bacterium]|nr:dihydrofolate reductase [Candidatus Saccharibacteria bacterium]MBR3176344.1 dihydrofolate reductase [Candidatus Saccharibacteria bacterium]